MGPLGAGHLFRGGNPAKALGTRGPPRWPLYVFHKVAQGGKPPLKDDKKWGALHTGEKKPPGEGRETPQGGKRATRVGKKGGH